MIKKNKPKVVIINKETCGGFDQQIIKAINIVRKLGITNIIVKNRTNKNYNYGSYISYINNNKKIIVDNAFDKKSMEELIPLYDTITTTWDNIFHKKNLMFINYLKWCCS